MIRGVRTRFMNSIEKKSKIVVAFFFALLLFLGIILVKDYGMPWDEFMEMDIMFSNVKEYERAFGGGDSKTIKILEEQGIEDILFYEEKDHGEAAYYLIAPVILHVLIQGDFDEMKTSRTVMIIWHLYTYGIFLLAVFCMYCCMKYLTKDWRYGILASLFLYLSPRMFAEGYYNNKDIVLMSLIIMSIWCGVLFVETKKYRYGALFGIVSAFAANTRVMGFWLFGLIGVLYLVSLFMNNEWSKKTFICGVSAIVAFFLMLIAITPATWNSILGYFEYVFVQSMNFVRWDGVVYYQGKIYHNGTNPLPWHYLPVMVAVTTPILIVVLIVIGHFTTVIETFRVKGKGVFKSEYKLYWILIMFVWGPLIYVFLKSPTIYNGWRHFYFIYGPLIMLAVGGVKALLATKNKIVTYALKGAMVLQIIGCMVVIILTHPKQFAYYNVLAGDEGQYESDYWNVSAASCIIKLLDQEDGHIKISAREWWSIEGLWRAQVILPKEYRNRVEIIPFEDMDTADYWISSVTYERIMEQTNPEIAYDFEKYGELVVSEKVFENTIMAIYKERE